MKVPICTPVGLDCVAGIETEYEECLPACQGVFITDVKTEIIQNIQDIDGLLRTYEDFRSHNQGNVTFPTKIKGSLYN